MLHYGIATTQLAARLRDWYTKQLLKELRYFPLHAKSS